MRLARPWKLRIIPPKLLAKALDVFVYQSFTVNDCEVMKR